MKKLIVLILSIFLVFSNVMTVVASMNESDFERGINSGSLNPSIYEIAFRTYDPEGLKIYSSSPVVTRPKTTRYGSNLIHIFVPQIKKGDMESIYMRSKVILLESNFKTVSDAHLNLEKSINVMEKIHINEKNLLTADDKITYKVLANNHEDININAHIIGGIKQITVYDPTGEKYAVVKSIHPGSPFIIKNAIAGEWKIELEYFSRGEITSMGLSADDITVASTPYALIVSTIPSQVMIDIPEYTNDPTILEKLLGSKQDTILIQKNEDLTDNYGLSEGLNELLLVRKIDDHVSFPKRYSITLDTIPPEIELTDSILRETTLNHTLINGSCSNDVVVLYINGEPVMLGSYDRNFAEGYLLEIGKNVFTLKAIDRAGNMTEKELVIVRR